MIDWTNSTSQVSTHFTVKDCLFLPSWNRLANEDDGLNDTIKENLINLCAKMEAVRTFLGCHPVIVHCTYRPAAYNSEIGGAANSPHITGEAMDYHLQGFEGNDGCDEVRKLLIPQLEGFNIRMENISNKSDRTWVHNDLRDPVINRYFLP